MVADKSVAQDIGVMENGERRRAKGSNRDDVVEQRGVDETEGIGGVEECDEVRDGGEVTEENIALEENNEVTPTVQRNRVSEIREGNEQICPSGDSNESGQANNGQIGTEIRREGIDKDRHGDKRKKIQRKQRDKAKKVTGNVETEGRKRRRVVNTRQTAGQLIERQAVQKSKDVGTQDNGEGKVARELGDARRDIGETGDSGITKIIEGEKDVFLIKDSNSRKDSGGRKGSDPRKDTDKREDDIIVSRNDDEIRNDGEPRSGETRNNIEKDVYKVNDGDLRTRAGKSRDQRDVFSGSADEEAVKSSEAIRKILEGKPFICPVCDKAYASKNGLKHHYDKTHLKPRENKSSKVTDHITMHLFFCRECDEGFKTERRLCFHKIKVHGLMELSSDEESDSEMTGQAKNIRVVRARTNSTKDMAARGDCNARNDVIGYVGTCGDHGVPSVARGNQGVSGVVRGDGDVGSDAKDEGNTGYDPRTNGNENVNETRSDDVEYIDGRKVVQRKITEWFRSTTK